MNITNYITECIDNNIPVSFSKYGDGEYLCAFYRHGKNCDQDSYTDLLGNSLIQSFQYMVENAENSYIGLWHDNSNKSKWETLVKKPVKWANYHTIIMDKKDDIDKLNLYKAIKNSKRKKVIVCNPLLNKSKLLLNIDSIVTVPFNNWFDRNFETILNQVMDEIEDDPNPLVITCCGMSAKVLICELYKRYPNGIFLDFGSAIDFICTKKDSRGFNRYFDYEYLKNYMKELIPDNWDDHEFESIYNEARLRMGVHL